MKAKAFRSQLVDAEIVAAIARAESTTSGEIRVFISHERKGDVMALAREAFERLGMTRTSRHNAVLLCVVPELQQVAVVGDTGVDAVCGQAGWQVIVDAFLAEMRAGQPTAAVVSAVGRIGSVLAEHFPHQPGDVNELPDAPMADDA
jgi:uncharacterized membrane protein